MNAKNKTKSAVVERKDGERKNGERKDGERKDGERKDGEPKKGERKSGEQLLAEGPILGTMLRLGIPTFVAMLVNLLYNIVDRIYIGHIQDAGAMALTGVGVCLPIISLISAFFSLIGAGGSPLCGIAFGKGDKNTAGKILGNSFTALVALSVVLTVVFQLVKRPFLYMFGASDVTYRYAGEYITIYLWGTIFVMLAYGLNTFIIVQGQSTTAMLSVLIGAVLNLVLDPVFIFLLHLGVRGAALATILSQAVSAVWVLHFLCSEKAQIRIRRENLKPDKRVIGQILALGVSPFIMSATESLITVVFNSGAQRYGNDLYVGSITILQSVLLIIFTPLNGFTQGVSPLISYNYGAGNLPRVRKTCRILIGITGGVSFVMTMLFMGAPGTVAGFFTDDPQLLTICRQMLPVFVAGMLVFGLQSGCQTCFMALGKAKQAFFFAMLRKVILLTPLAILLPMVMNDIKGLYLAEPISDSLSAVTCFIVFLITLRGVMKSGK